VIREAGNEVDVGAGVQESFGGPALSTVTGLPERFVNIHLGWGRAGGQQLIHATKISQTGGVPQIVDWGTGSH